MAEKQGGVSRSSAAPDVRQLFIQVRFEAPSGETWTAIGGGDTLEDALEFARDSCPEGPDWRVVSWNDVYGE
jgi:hypothetical protein